MSAERTARRMRKNLRTFGAHGSDKRVPMRAFASLAQLIAWVKSQGCRVVGVEIDDSAVSCFSPEAWPVRPTCLLPGNEGDGLSQAQIELCDALVYVPQYAAATASLNVNAATACVLSCFAHAVGYAEEATASGARNSTSGTRSTRCGGRRICATLRQKSCAVPVFSFCEPPVRLARDSGREKPC